MYHYSLVVGIKRLPTTKEMCVIKAIPMLVNNDEVQEIPEKVLELATEWLDELKPNKED